MGEPTLNQEKQSYDSLVKHRLKKSRDAPEKMLIQQLNGWISNFNLFEGTVNRIQQNVGSLNNMLEWILLKTAKKEGYSDLPRINETFTKTEGVIRDKDIDMVVRSFKDVYAIVQQVEKMYSVQQLQKNLAGKTEGEKNIAIHEMKNDLQKFNAKLHAMKVIIPPTFINPLFQYLDTQLTSKRKKKMSNERHYIYICM